MDASSRLRNRMRGAPVDRAPNFNIVMQFAAHFVGRPLSRFYLDHRVLVEANLAAAGAFGLDLLQAISDPYREAHDLGASIRFPEDGLPVCEGPLIREPEDLSRLRHADPSSGRRMSDRLEAVASMARASGGATPVMGWVEGALSLAATLRGVNTLLTDLLERPDWAKELLAFTAEQSVRFARAQVDAGADLIGLGDSLASQISPDLYREFALPHEKRAFGAVREKGALARLHICGDTSRIVPDMAATGADIIDLDWMVGLVAARAAVGPDRVLCGNFDPVAVMLQGTPEGVRDAVRANLRDGGARFLSAAGCEIPDRTPHANLRAHAEALAEASAEGGTA